MPERKQLADEDIREFLASHRLPAEYGEAISTHFLPLYRWLERRHSPGKTQVVGINGAQGTGKSTLGDFLALASNKLTGGTSVVLSIDDFYLTQSERETLASEQHPLLRTRGVPGTHDVPLLTEALDRLCALEPGQSFAPPRFDKSIDDRAPPPWPSVEGPVSLIVLEGWCVGTPFEDDDALEDAINDLERQRDPGGEWRQWVNERLRSDYKAVWDRLDALVYLKAPDFDAIFRWRLEQEQKLAATAGAEASGIMSEAEVREFIGYYERLTRRALDVLPDKADVVFELGRDHAVKAAVYR